MKIVRLMLVGLMVSTFSVFGVALPSQAASSGININRACELQYGNIYRAVLVANNVYGWRCSGGGNTYGVNLNLECSRYNGNAYAGYSNYNDPYSWRCYW